MTFLEKYAELKKQIIGENLVLTSIEEVDELHEKYIALRAELFRRQIMEFMPHYRGEQFYGWELKNGIFRPPLNLIDPLEAKQLEKAACLEFEKEVIKGGTHILRDTYYYEKYGKEWDLLFQAQHGGVKTTITDWTAFIQSAAYFAVEYSENPDIEKADGQLWCMLTPIDFILAHTDDNWKNFYNQDPLSIDQYYIINPSIHLDNLDNRLYEKRMHRQKGRFLISPANACNIDINKEPILEKYIMRFRIPYDKKESIRNALIKRGLTRDYVYVQEDNQIKSIALSINNSIFKNHIK